MYDSSGEFVEPQYFVFKDGRLSSEHRTLSGARYASKGGQIYADRDGTALIDKQGKVLPTYSATALQNK